MHVWEVDDGPDMGSSALQRGVTSIRKAGRARGVFDKLACLTTHWPLEGKSIMTLRARRIEYGDPAL